MMIIENKMSICSLLTGAHLILTGVEDGWGVVDLFGTLIFWVLWPEIKLQLYQSHPYYFQQQMNFLTREKETSQFHSICL